MTYVNKLEGTGHERLSENNLTAARNNKCQNESIHENTHIHTADNTLISVKKMYFFIYLTL